MVKNIEGPLGVSPPKEAQDYKVKIKKDKKGVERGDKVTISAEAKKLSQSAALIREDKVELAKVRVASNFYDSKGKEIAEKILNEWMSE